MSAPRWTAALTALTLAGCVAVDPAPDHDRATAWIEARTGVEAGWAPGSLAASDAALGPALADGLGREEAVALALSRSRELRAGFHELGIAHADWAASRTLANPEVSALFAMPLDGGRWLIEGALGMELLQLWRVPLAGDVARLELDAKVLAIADRAVALAAEVRAAHDAAVAVSLRREGAEHRADLLERTVRAVEDLAAVGAADALGLARARGPWLEARLDLEAAEAADRAARRELARLVGWTGEPGVLQLSPFGLQEIAAEDPDPAPGPAYAASLATALERRLDLRALDALVTSLEAGLDLAEREAWGDLDVSANVERPDGSGGSLVGPGVGWTVPLFDRGAAGLLRARSELGRLVEEREALRLEVAYQVSAALDRLEAARRGHALLMAELLPQANRTWTLTQEAHLAGQVDLLERLEADREVLEAGQRLVDLWLERQQAEADLERALGGRPGADPVD